MPDIEEGAIMANGTIFFSHDCNARNDLKLIRLNHKHGMAGVGIYWCLVEMLYENDGYLMRSDCECIANALRVEMRTLCDIIENSELFNFDDEKFWSESALKRIKKILEKSQKATDSALKRWGNANAMPTQCEGNANKVNKNRINNKEINKEIVDVNNLFNTFWNEYPKKVAKQDAAKAFKKIKPTEELIKIIIQKVQEFKKSEAWLKDGGQFIPNPATFLNGRRWEDEITGGNNGKTNSANNGKILKPDEFTDPDEYFRQQRNEHR